MHAQEQAGSGGALLICGLTAERLADENDYLAA